MAKLQIKDKVALGAFMIEHAGDMGLKNELQDPDKAKATFDPFLVIPPNVTIKVVFDDENLTHIIMPWKTDIDKLVKAVEEEALSPYSEDYVDEPLKNIKIKDTPKKAMNFRVGEYTMSRCKT